MKTVTIIGFGRFGKVLHRLIKGDFKILIYTKKPLKTFKFDKNTSTTTDLKKAYESSVIFYCVPIPAFESVIKSHKKYFRDGQVLIDVLSVKVHPKKVFEKYLKGNKVEAMLTHPMFGPDSSKNGFKGLRLVINKFRSNKKNYEFWKKYFISKKLNVVEMTAERHDKLAAQTQGIAHFATKILSQVGFPRTNVDTKSVERLREVVEHLSNDTWDLFIGLQNYNPYVKSVRANFLKSANSISRKLAKSKRKSKKKIYGIQGGAGSFNEEALTTYLKKKKAINFKAKYLFTSENVLKALNDGSIDYGIFATHNSAGGIVTESVEAMSRYNFKIVEKITIRISHHLMKRHDANKAKIKTIMAHPQVFKQCKGTLAKRFKKYKLVNGKGNLVDTANAAKALSEGKIPKNTAILGPRRLAEIYNFDVLASNLQDDKTNETSFLLVSK